MLLLPNWNDGGNAMSSKSGADPSLRDILSPLTGLTVAEAKAIGPRDRHSGQKLLTSDGKQWRFHPTSVVAADGDRLVLVPDSGSGRWLAEPGQVIDLSMAIGFGTADAAALYTMPVGSALLLRRGYWGVTTDWTGGTGSTIGVSSSQTGHTTKGDLHGGAAGDAAATLVAAGGLFIPGTIGADVAAGIILVGGSILRHDRITSAFTGGAGFAHIVGELLANAGA